MRELTPLHARVLIGVGIKSLGYLIIASGIFLSLKDKNLALKVVYVGVCFVVFGWFLVLRALKLASFVKVRKSERFDRNFKISAHVSGGLFGIKEGDSAEIVGVVKERCGKRWIPAKGSVVLVLNGVVFGRCSLKDGKFSFRLRNLRRGNYDVHVRHVEGCEEKRLKLNVMSFDEWKRCVMTVVVAVILLFMFVVLSLIPLLVKI